MIVIDDIDKTVYAMLCQKYGLEKSDFDREINIEGVIYRIAGIYSKATKYPIKLIDLNGKKFRKDEDEVLRALGRMH